MHIQSTRIDATSIPQFNLIVIDKVTANQHNKLLDWLQTQQNNGGLFLIGAYVDRQSNIYINDLKLYLEYLKHCLGFSSVQAGV